MSWPLGKCLTIGFVLNEAQVDYGIVRRSEFLANCMTSRCNTDMDNCRRIDQSLLCSRYLSVDL